MRPFFTALSSFIFATTIANAAGTGSGFFVSNNGHIATNYHVIEGAEKIYVRTYNGQRHLAKVAFVDQQKDLAILSINAQSSPLYLRNINSNDKGGKVYTLGYPSPMILGFKETKYAEGVVSSIVGSDSDPSVFQVSTPLQPGNSGGPLLTQDGYVVGVVKAKPSQIGTLKNSGFLIENVSYAIKSDYLSPMLVNLNINTRYVAPKEPIKLNALEKSIVLVVVFHAEDSIDYAKGFMDREASSVESSPQYPNKVGPNYSAATFDGNRSLVGFEFSVVGADELEFSVIDDSQNGWRKIKTKSGTTLDTYNGLAFLYNKNSAIGLFYEELINSLGTWSKNTSATSIHNASKGSWRHTLHIDNIQKIQTPIGVREVAVITHTEEGLHGNNFKEIIKYYIDIKSKIPWQREVTRLSGNPSDRTSFRIVLVKIN
jgi:hypothetical protein